MKTDALKEIIRKIVQQEVKAVLRNELRTCLAEILLTQDGKKSQLKETSSTKMQDLIEQEQVEEQPTPAPKKFVKYTSNDVLNQILNETTGGVPREGQYVGLSEGFSPIGADGSVISDPVSPVQVPEAAPKEVKSVYQAMTRDYSKLMKAIDKKRNKA